MARAESTTSGSVLTRPRWQHRWWQRIRGLWRGDEGMSTAEYAVGTVAAAAFASILYTVVTGDSVTQAMTGLIQRAMEASF